METHCRDSRGAGGYTGGYEGWEPEPRKLLYKSTEHNIDLYAVFQRLFLATGEEKWEERARHARRFVESMWDEVEGKFWTGTRDDGATANHDVIPVDAQAWAVLALGEEGKPFWAALEYAEANLKVGGGFDFDEDGDGIWYEGTAQMAAAYQATGEPEMAAEILGLLMAAQLESGALHACDQDGLTTGFNVPVPEGDPIPWLYYRRAHVGATAWYVFAALGVNPFWNTALESVN